ncbi:MAG: diacylglycerol kinase family lipid kinase [Deltaproteobacteria bacterium]|nr:MAG: diacylglycerol kinase family lipid kinase [Deltaproteobacteria bacterium]
MAENFKTKVIINPHSANRSTRRQWPGIAEGIKRSIGDFDWEFTTGPNTAPELTRNALREGYEMVVGVGGDGTNNEIINGFFEADLAINPEAVYGMICRGTGSDLIRTLGIPRDPGEAARILAGKRTRRIDLGRLSFRDHRGREARRYFINIASFGIGGEVDARVNQTTKAFGGWISFLYGSVRANFAYKNKSVDIELDGDSLGTRKIFNSAIANGQYFGGGMRVAPQARMDDGLFDIVIMGDLSFLESVRMARLIYKGDHVNLPKIESFRGKKLSATSEQRVLLDVDGEQPGILPASLEIIPGAIRIKV